MENMPEATPVQTEYDRIHSAMERSFSLALDGEGEDRTLALVEWKRLTGELVATDIPSDMRPVFAKTVIRHTEYLMTGGVLPYDSAAVDECLTAVERINGEA